MPGRSICDVFGIHNSHRTHTLLSKSFFPCVCVCRQYEVHCHLPEYRITMCGNDMGFSLIGTCHLRPCVSKSAVPSRFDTFGTPYLSPMQSDCHPGDTLVGFHASDGRTVADFGKNKGASNVSIFFFFTASSFDCFQFIHFCFVFFNCKNAATDKRS